MPPDRAESWTHHCLTCIHLAIVISKRTGVHFFAKKLKSSYYFSLLYTPCKPNKGFSTSITRKPARTHLKRSSLRPISGTTIIRFSISRRPAVQSLSLPSERSSPSFSFPSLKKFKVPPPKRHDSLQEGLFFLSQLDSLPPGFIPARKDVKLAAVDRRSHLETAPKLLFPPFFTH